MRAAEQGEELLEELVGEAVNDAIGRLAEDGHLPLVRLRHAVALEAVLVHIWQYHRSFCSPLALIRFAIALGVRKSLFPIAPPLRGREEEGFAKG